MPRAHYKTLKNNCKLTELGLAAKSWLELSDELAAEGWKTPNSYGGDFAVVPETSGVYLFALVDVGVSVSDHATGLVGYVGMSKNLLKRVSAHPTKRKIEKLGVYIRVYFLTAPADEIRDLERDLIRRFNPAWNLIGKKVGVQV